MPWQVLTDGLTYGGDHPSLQKSVLLMVEPEEKWGPVKLKSHYGEGGSPPSEKLFLRATCVI